MIYVHRATITTVSGTVGSTTLNVKGGLCQQVLVRSLTSGLTIFRANLTDSSANLIVRNYAFHEGEINDVGMGMPLAGVYTLNITNASATDTFAFLLAVDE